MVLRLATENSTWGYGGVRGELRRFGDGVGVSTVWVYRELGRGAACGGDDAVLP